MQKKQLVEIIHYSYRYKKDKNINPIELSYANLNESEQEFVKSLSDIQRMLYFENQKLLINYYKAREIDIISYTVDFCSSTAKLFISDKKWNILNKKRGVPLFLYSIDVNV